MRHRPHPQRRQESCRHSTGAPHHHTTCYNYFSEGKRLVHALQTSKAKNMNANRGYVGYSMSRRAAAAHDEGLMPWGKITAQRVRDAHIPYTLAQLKVLRDARLIAPEEWHHTSSRFNKTDFWSVESIAEQLRARPAEQIKHALQQAQQTEETQAHGWVTATWTEFHGSTNHRKKVERTEDGYLFRGWVYLAEGKKSTGGNWFHGTTPVKGTPHLNSEAVKSIKDRLPPSVARTMRTRGKRSL